MLSWREIIPVQEKLALGKLRADQVFEQLAELDIRVQQRDLTELLASTNFLPLAKAETLTRCVVRVTDGETHRGPGCQQGSPQGPTPGNRTPPSAHQAYGTKSKEHLSDLVAGKSVCLITVSLTVITGYSVRYFWTVRT